MKFKDATYSSGHLPYQTCRFTNVNEYIKNMFVCFFVLILKIFMYIQRITNLLTQSLFKMYCRKVRTSQMQRKGVKVWLRARSNSRPNSKRQLRDWKMKRKSMLSWLARRGSWRMNALSWRKILMTWSSPWLKWKRRNMQLKTRLESF